MVLKNNNCNRNLKGMDMKKRLSRKQMFFNKINLTKDDEVYVGIDVHKKSHSVEIWLRGSNALLKTCRFICHTRESGYPGTYVNNGFLLSPAATVHSTASRNDKPKFSTEQGSNKT